MIEKILLLILLIVLTINLINLIKIKWNNDYFKENFNQCYILNSKSLYELETYRHKLYKYIYNIDNNNFENTINTNKITLKIIIILLVILLLFSIKDIYINYRANKVLISIVVLIIILIYIYISNKTSSDHEKIEEVKKDKRNNINKYRIVYKILNSLLYLDENNNIINETFNFRMNKIKNNKTFDKYLESNISQIYNTSNQNEINYLKMQSYKKLDFIKYINLDEISPFYFKEYFDNIYIIVDNNKIFLNNISDNSLINNMIKNALLKSGEKVEDIDGIDYIKYYNENKSLLFDINRIKNEISNIINDNWIIYILLIIYIFIIIITFHILYYTINKNIYIIILLIIKILFLVMLWLQFRMN
jgi:hypothetical protein